MRVYRNLYQISQEEENVVTPDTNVTENVEVSEVIEDNENNAELQENVETAEELTDVATESYDAVLPMLDVNISKEEAMYSLAKLGYSPNERKISSEDGSIPIWDSIKFIITRLIESIKNLFIKIGQWLKRAFVNLYAMFALRTKRFDALIIKLKKMPDSVVNKLSNTQIAKFTESFLTFIKVKGSNPVYDSMKFVFEQSQVEKAITMMFIQRTHAIVQLGQNMDKIENDKNIYEISKLFYKINTNSRHDMLLNVSEVNKQKPFLTFLEKEIKNSDIIPNYISSIKGKTIKYSYLDNSKKVNDEVVPVIKFGTYSVTPDDKDKTEFENAISKIITNNSQLIAHCNSCKKAIDEFKKNLTEIDKLRIKSYEAIVDGASLEKILPKNMVQNIPLRNRGEIKDMLLASSILFGQGYNAICNSMVIDLIMTFIYNINLNVRLVAALCGTSGEKEVVEGELVEEPFALPKP